MAMTELTAWSFLQVLLPKLLCPHGIIIKVAQHKLERHARIYTQRLQYQRQQLQTSKGQDTIK